MTQTSIRFVTWNLWLTNGDWQKRQPAIVETLRRLDPDVVALQETWHDHDTEPSQVASLAAALDMHFVVSPGPDGFESPIRNAMLSRWPLSGTAGGLLASDIEHRYRSVVMAEIDSPIGTIRAFTTHLEHRYNKGGLRQRQLDDLVGFIDQHHPVDTPGFPPVLLGDLNAVPDSDEVRRLSGRSAPYHDRVFLDAWEMGGSGPGYTWSTDNQYLAAGNPQWPNRRIDYVFVGYPSKGPAGRVDRITMAGDEPVDGVTPSDHFALVADLRTAEAADLADDT